MKIAKIMFKFDFCTQNSKTANTKTESRLRLAKDGVKSLKNAIITTITHAEAINPQVAERSPFKISAAIRDSLNLLKHL